VSERNKEKYTNIINMYIYRVAIDMQIATKHNKRGEHTKKREKKKIRKACI
jgi:hypothetical protein